MSGLLDLPPELVIRIAQELRNDTYTAKERQSDLARLAKVRACSSVKPCPPGPLSEVYDLLGSLQVHPTLTVVARSLLYGGQVTARSAGRTHLLARSLTSNPTLSEFIRTLSFKSENDAGHVESLVTILKHCPLLEDLTLSAVYLLKNPPASLYGALQAHAQLRAFSYGFQKKHILLETIAPLLQSFPNLKHLALTGFVEPEIPRFTFSSLRFGPPPSYSLESLSITDWLFPCTKMWVTDELEWVFGATDGLRAFEARELDATRVPLDDILDCVARRSRLSGLRKFVFRQCFVSAPPRLIDPNSLATLYPQLEHLSLMPDEFESSFAIPEPHLVLPPQLRTLQLDEDLFLSWRLLETIRDPSLPRSLRQVRLRGPFASDPDVKLLKRACTVRGIECEVTRAF
ncbi:uncharacterized protein JCM15063_005030 [Sporobolomyces koalae]|uniref:uncharacterized protein n=1 Tax=Sporobolomyces koalae TaxID=500713 RepID=UPI003172FDB5